MDPGQQDRRAEVLLDDGLEVRSRYKDLASTEEFHPDTDGKLSDITIEAHGILSDYLDKATSLWLGIDAMTFPAGIEEHVLKYIQEEFYEV